MKRIDFLRQLGLGVVSSAVLAACKTDEVTTDTTTTTGSTNGSSSADCAITNSETAGPFPIKDPTKVILTNIKGDRAGVAMTMKVIIKNKNGSCAALQGVLVDLWHCDAAGNYSQYGGTNMQSTNYTSVNWLRGRQTTDANGLVTFGSIFPGWYGGRAPHVHAHIYTAAGKSLLVTQIAFPKAVCDTVYTTASDYKSKGTQDTTNERDNVFSDGFTNELGTLEGSIAAGYTLTHTIVVSA
ncbi:MAG: intradiol ring-cleavage dioxygenase [Arcicella sp.]|nr:intradiol ring-cleavage dioxygenase [Arcicella sp.]